ncbi:hypothetical protein OTB20_40925 [Streptomyces sp. H27-H1]|nr:hypothetical protein [Streptomyces sp. H27-H1]
MFLALTDEKGNLIWISTARPGRSSEITAARHDHICAHLRAADLGALADLGFTGLDDDPDHPLIVTGLKATRGHPLTPPRKRRTSWSAANAQPTSTASPYLKNWRILTKMRLYPHHATTLLRALLVLTNAEVQR